MVFLQNIKIIKTFFHGGSRSSNTRFAEELNAITAVAKRQLEVYLIGTGVPPASKIFIHIYIYIIKT